MVIDNLIGHMESWAPPGVAWDRDNVGLLVGSGGKEIRNVFLCLELNGQALTEALKKDCNFIITHHPLIFNPIRKLNPQKDSSAALIEKLIRNDISLYTAHTNLDYTKEGVSFALAAKLKLENVKFLSHFEENQFKLVVYVPSGWRDKVAEAVFEAGGGIIGEYSGCSFRLNGEGTFKGSEKTNPAVGKKNVFETVEETRLEVSVNSFALPKVVSAMIKAHPYEEPAYDVVKLKNGSVNFGEGAIGTLNKEMSEKDFIKFAAKSLGAEGLRFAQGAGKKISRVAVCGGAGADLLKKAIAAGADAFVTGDVKYHTFQDAEKKILLLDAGHYETEIHALGIVKEKIENIFRKEKVKSKVRLYSGTTNPVKFYKQKEQ